MRPCPDRARPPGRRPRRSCGPGCTRWRSPRGPAMAGAASRHSSKPRAARWGGPPRAGGGGQAGCGCRPGATGGPSRPTGVLGAWWSRIGWRASVPWPRQRTRAPPARRPEAPPPSACPYTPDRPGAGRSALCLHSGALGARPLGARPPPSPRHLGGTPATGHRGRPHGAASARAAAPPARAGRHGPPSRPAACARSAGRGWCAAPGQRRPQQRGADGSGRSALGTRAGLRRAAPTAGHARPPGWGPPGTTRGLPLRLGPRPFGCLP